MKNKGFTLIELSIVIIIIGFLIGGVLIGQSMIRSAELREVIGDYERYIKAIKEFQDKYNALPGDMKNAETIWGSDATCPNTPVNTVPKILTCNGDGNGRIGDSSVAGVVTNGLEWFRAWQQLSNAGLVEGKFTGTTGNGFPYRSTIGLNVPKSKLSEYSGWTLLYYLYPTTDSDMWGDNYGHILYLGQETARSYTRQPFLRSTDALNLDQKIDDGLPGRGFIRTRRTAGDTLCTTNDTTQDAATYNTSYIEPDACALFFILGF